MLTDVLAPEMKVVFCGTAAGAASARASAYYAGPGNKFWRTLHEVGFTPERLEPRQFQDVLGYGLGLTDVCKTASGSDREIGNRRWDVPGLIAKLESCRPKWVAFNGKKAAEAVLERKVDYGRQAERLGPAGVFVLPSTSGAASGAWSRTRWEELARLSGCSR
jgi:double-stranded uracil-DNA glycosylase